MNSFFSNPMKTFSVSFYITTQKGSSSNLNEDTFSGFDNNNCKDYCCQSKSLN